MAGFFVDGHRFAHMIRLLHLPMHDICNLASTLCAPQPYPMTSELSPQPIYLAAVTAISTRMNIRTTWSQKKRLGIHHGSMSSASSLLWSSACVSCSSATSKLPPRCCCCTT